MQTPFPLVYPDAFGSGTLPNEQSADIAVFLSSVVSPFTGGLFDRAKLTGQS